MDVANVGIVGVMVITIVGAIKDTYPLMTGNQTRLVAVIIGALLGLLGQFNLLIGLDVNVVTGILSAVAAVATVTVADRIH